MAHEIFTEALGMTPELIKWRRELHQIPELGLKLPQTADYLIGRITEMAVKTADAYRAKAEVTALYNVPMVDNDPELNMEFIESIRELDGNLVTQKALHVMGSEDFSFFTNTIPAVYMAFGAGVEDQTRWRAQHNPEIVFNEKVLSVGAAAYVKIATDYLTKRSKR